MRIAVKKVFIAIVGGTVLLIGLALLVLPGPGIPVIAAGIAILATEFFWAKHVFRKLKVYAFKMRHRLHHGLNRMLRRRVNPADGQPILFENAERTYGNGVP